MRRPLLVSLVVLAAYILFYLKVLSSHGWDPRVFIMERREEVPLEQGWDIGYDAQYYYAIAADPLNAASKVDIPAFRYQRIVFPLLIRAASLGKIAWMPWTMLLINLLSASVIAGILAELLSRRGVSGWFALALIFSLGFMLSMRMDLLEPLTLALGLGGWITYDEKKPATGTLLFALSGLTKEIGLIFPAAIAAWLLWRGSRRAAVWVVIGSIIPYLVWRIYLTSQFGRTSEADEVSRLTWIPFSGFLTYQDLPGILFVGIWTVIPTILAGLVLAWDVWFRRSVLQHPEVFLMVFHVGLIATLPRLTWIDPLAVLRTSSGLLISLLLWLSICHPRGLRYLAAIQAPSGLIMAIVPGFL